MEPSPNSAASSTPKATLNGAAPAPGPGEGYTFLALQKGSGRLLAATVERVLVVLGRGLRREAAHPGFLDEVLGLAFAGPERLAVASNGPQVTLLRTRDLSAELLPGHQDTILSLAVDPSG